MFVTFASMCFWIDCHLFSAIQRGTPAPTVESTWEFFCSDVDCMLGSATSGKRKDRKKKKQNTGCQKHPRDCFITGKVKEYKWQVFWECCVAICQCLAVMFMLFPTSMTQYSLLVNMHLGFFLSTIYVHRVLMLLLEIYFNWKQYFISATSLKSELPAGNSIITFHHQQQNRYLPVFS